MALSDFFSTVDYVVFVVTLAISVGSGVYYAFSGGRQNTTAEFLLGNRGLSAIPVAFSLMVSFESAILLMGGPAEVYMYGIQWIVAIFGYVVSDILISQTFVPFLHRLGITSVYEYLELRFESHAIRLFGTFLGICREVIYMGMVLYAPALAVEVVVGFPLWASIVTVGTAAVVYTFLGGIKAVVWTDVFQAILMFTGILAFIIKGTLDVGGPTQVVTLAAENGRLNFFNFDPDPTTRHTFWSLFFGSLIGGLRKPFDQTSFQRIRSTKKVQDAKRMYLATSVLYLLINCLVITEGLVLYSYYHQLRCDPLHNQSIRDSNQILPFTIMRMFMDTPGLPGVFMASLFSACLSSLSSSLTSLSALFWEDIVKPHTRPMYDTKATFLTKLSVLGFGIVGVGIAFLVSTISGTLVQVVDTVEAVCDGPLTGIFLIGCLFPWINAMGVFAGCLGGVIIIAWIVIGSITSSTVRITPPLRSVPQDLCMNLNQTSLYNVTVKGGVQIPTAYYIENSIYGLDAFYSVSYKLYPIISIMTVMIVASAVSIVAGRRVRRYSDHRYIISISQACNKMNARGRKQDSREEKKYINESQKPKEMKNHTTTSSV